MRNVFLALLVLLIVVNTLQLTLRIIDHSRTQSGFLGDQFKEIAPLFAHVRQAGYYTDKNLDQDLRAMAQFEQAQYILAPTILDLNNTQHSLVIFDCSTPVVAVQKITELGLKPVRINNFGVILAFNPKVQEFSP
jgi:hypothetical protein